MENILARTALYNFFARVFGEPPTPDLLAALQEMFPNLTPVVTLETLQQEYTSLLVGPGDHYAPPYASIYLHPSQNGKAYLWGPEASAVEELYRAAGLEIAPGQSRVPDHLALELQFLHHLCACEANSDIHGQPEETAHWRRQQQTFLQEHLLPWLPRFVEKLKQAQPRPFYGAVGEIVLGFLQTELDALTTQSVSLE
jgi:TorA maturation chaperone TorD